MDKMFKLTEHVYILPFDADTDRPNLGYITGGENAVLFDAGCGPKTVGLLKNELTRNNMVTPDKVIISHFHWDHSFASGYIGGQLIGTEYTQKKMVEMKNMQIDSLEDLIDDENLMPQFCRDHLPLEYDDVAKIKLRTLDITLSEGEVCTDDIHIQLKEVISPHCEGQMIAYVKEDKVLFVGDSYSAQITGYDFIDNREKRILYYDIIKQFDFDYIVLSHFDVMSKEDFWREAMEKLQ